MRHGNIARRACPMVLNDAELFVPAFVGLWVGLGLIMVRVGRWTTLGLGARC